MKATSTLLAVVLGSATALAGAQSGSPATTQKGDQSGGTVMSRQPAHTQSMEKLTQAAQRLRESIQAMAQNKEASPARDKAIERAQQALLETQAAMVQLPPEMRSWGTVSTADYDASVKKLMKAADSLRESIQAMSQHPAGDRRNQAIQRANEALMETQSAMASAYTPGSGAKSSSSPTTMGAGASNGSGAAAATTKK